MRRCLIFVGLLALLLPVSVAVAKSNGNKDSVTGGFHDIYGFNNGVQASSGPSGENPTGHGSSTDRETGDKIREKAVCVAVSGNLAATGMIGTLNGEPYTEILIYRDGGPSGANDGFDSVSGDPHDCQSKLALAAGAPAIRAGNILIKDATP
jgi:hypothetical protein